MLYTSPDIKYDANKTMSQTIIRLFFFTAMLMMLGSCSNDVVIAPAKPKPKALGKMNSVTVLTDKQMWEGAVGDSLRHYFGGEYPITPRPEPLFDLRFFPTEKIEYEEILRELRVYLVVVNLNDEESSTTKMLKRDIGESKFNQAKKDPEYTTSVGKNKWAYNQLIIYVFGNSHDEIMKEIRENFGAIAMRIKAHDTDQLASLTYVKGENIGLSKELKSKYGYSFKVPGDFKVVIDEPQNNYYQLRKDYEDDVLIMSFSEYPYTSTDQLSKAYLKEIKNKHGRDRSYSTEPNSFMVINDIDLPILEYPFNKEGSYGKEFRGIWELENDFMGGPYISYLFINEEKGKILLVDTWVHAPGKKKRNYLQQLELIVKGK